MKISKPSKYILILLAILAIAIFFRIWQLNVIPPGLYPDEAINGNEAISNPGKIFYPANNGREGLFINLITLSSLIFGKGIFSLRLVSAIIGILTVLGLYLLTKELFQVIKGKKQATIIALLSSLFLAVSFWHVNFSRIVFRGILVPFVLVFAFYFLFKGFQTKKGWNFIISGIIFGLGFHTYIGFRVAVLLPLIVLICWWLIYKKRGLQRQYLSLVSCFLLFVLIVALPIGVYFLKNPDYFIARAGGVSIFAQNSNPPISQLKALGESSILHLGMFNFSGDPNWRHNLANSPELFWPIGILFLIGLAVSIKNFFIFLRNKQYLSFSIFCFLLGWWLIMLLPGILTYEGIPHCLRCIGAIPPVFIFSALGFEFLYRKIKGRIKTRTWNYKLIILALILLAISFIFAQYSRYFVLWAQNPEVKSAFSKNYVEIGNYLNSLEPETQKYVIVNELGVPLYGISIPAQTLMFIEIAKFDKPRAIYLKAENLDQIKVDQKKTVIIPLYGEKLFDELQKKFPGGKIQEKNGIKLMEIY